MQGLLAGKGSVSMDYEPDGLQCAITMAIPGERRFVEVPEPRTFSGTASSDEVSLKGIRVLVVEDEALVRVDLLDILRDAGATIAAEAGSLQEGINKSEATDFDVAILDRNLDGKSSMPLAELVARRGAGIVFVSGYRPDHADQALHGSRFVHLQKPVSAQALVAAISSIFAAKNR